MCGLWPDLGNLDHRAHLHRHALTHLLSGQEGGNVQKLSMNWGPHSKKNAVLGEVSPLFAIEFSCSISKWNFNLRFFENLMIKMPEKINTDLLITL